MHLSMDMLLRPPCLQGCLAPVTIRIPSPSILSPTAEAAVVGGNVLTSQRVTDVVLKAFNAAAASQVFSHALTGELGRKGGSEVVEA